MQITFRLPKSTAELLLLSAERMRLQTGREHSVHSIARALVQEVLIDDAAEHGLIPDTKRKH